MIQLRGLGQNSESQSRQRHHSRGCRHHITNAPRDLQLSGTKGPSRSDTFLISYQPFEGTTLHSPCALLAVPQMQMTLSHAYIPTL
jgi:hypothetical protein